MRWMLRSKIHRATVTETRLDYEGSITVDARLMEMAGILPGEKVLIADVNNGNRFETYTIAGPANSGVICINGAAAHLCDVGDLIIIMGFELADGIIDTSVVKVDRNNKPVGK